MSLNCCGRTLMAAVIYVLKRKTRKAKANAAIDIGCCFMPPQVLEKKRKKMNYLIHVRECSS
jgi:hypothetical protein